MPARLGSAVQSLGLSLVAVLLFPLDWLLPEHGVDVARAFVGTEGTWGVVAAATIGLARPPVVKVLLVASVPAIT